MANEIILPAYKMAATVFADTLKKKAAKKKFIFQCELKQITKNDACFGLVGYPLNKVKGKWKVGDRIDLIEDTSKKPYTFTPPLIFGNNELVSGQGGKTKPGSIYKRIKFLIKKKQSLKDLELNFTPKVSDNPHVYYDITIGRTSESANPSPPADPVV
jgi:hypothetical protein